MHHNNYSSVTNNKFFEAYKNNQKMNYLQIYWQSNLLEMPIYLLFIKTTKKERPWWQNFIFISGINSITHPIVFFGIMNFHLNYLQNIFIAESFAIITDAFILWWILENELFFCFTASLLANFMSWQLSPMITYILNSN